jgi:hypothetical protein
MLRITCHPRYHNSWSWPCDHDDEPFGSHEMQGIFLVAELLLALQEGLFHVIKYFLLTAVQVHLQMFQIWIKISIISVLGVSQLRKISVNVKHLLWKSESSASHAFVLIWVGHIVNYRLKLIAQTYTTTN